jgi:hypothetical protein
VDLSTLRRSNEPACRLPAGRQGRQGNDLFIQQPEGIQPTLPITSSLVGKAVKTAISSSLLVLGKVGKYRVRNYY